VGADRSSLPTDRTRRSAPRVPPKGGSVRGLTTLRRRRRAGPAASPGSGSRFTNRGHCAPRRWAYPPSRRLGDRRVGRDA
jgi:hypothetical protein